MAEKSENQLPVVVVLGHYYPQVVTDTLSDIGRLVLCRTEEDLIATKDVLALFLWHVPVEYFDDALMAKLPSLRMIVRMGVGYDNINIQAAGRRGIAVCNVPAYGTEEVADAAFSHILNIYRRTMTLAIDRSSQGAVAMTAYDMTVLAQGVTRLRGQKLGIIGLGRIGTAVSLRAKAFGMDVSFYDPYLPDGVEKSLGIRRHRRLDNLLAESDCITLHCSLNHKNRRMLGDAEFHAMKVGVRFVNTARGGLVDEAALARALTDGRVSYAALDVTEKEPFNWAESPLAVCKNVYVMPHTAWYSEQSIHDMWTMGSAEARRALLALQKDGSGPMIDELYNCVNAQWWTKPVSK